MTGEGRRTILVLAYSISPVRGSEYAVGWNYVTHMSHDHDLVVLYGLAGDHMGDVEEMAAVTPEQFGGHVTFVPVLPDARARIANHLNRTGRVPFSFYVAYRYWHLSALAAARRILAERQIDIVHYLCPIGFREPGYLWRLNRPYIWGPIGGIAPRPVRAFMGLSLADGLRTIVRNLVNNVQFKFGRRVRQGILNSDVLLAATTENALAVERVYRRAPIVVPENAIEPAARARHRSSANGVPLRMAWVGTIEKRKAITILLRALADLDRPGLWSLAVIGDGPLLVDAMQEARSLGIDRGIEWLGKISRQQAVERFYHTDVHVLTSLAEANTTVLWEAMSAGVPTVAIDHCGMHDSICDSCGVRVPLGTIKETSRGFAEAFNRLIDDPQAVERLSNGAIACAERYSWRHRVAFWTDIYDLAVATHGHAR
ncbi:glycosyltransferase family 4 protein [uncultured Sphingomonas sp.]|uniref:glycosyltransferase family 4 protein n=1 Tax=uncultured Sphingomonas sp. TaxID=158754 RepID=UPI0035CC765A